MLIYDQQQSIKRRSPKGSAEMKFRAAQIVSRGVEGGFWTGDFDTLSTTKLQIPKAEN
jgi:hypothetical protein